mgnify:CR=1 FL=1
MDLKNKHVSVVGMASSGIAAALFLRQHGARVVISESKAAEELRSEIPRLLEAGVAIETGGHRERTFLDADFIVLSPGVPTDLPLLQRARAQRVPILGEVELAARFLQGAMVAITGSNGKTTTTSMTGEVLAACGYPVQVGGNIGTPLIALVASSRPDGVNVVELSSFQLETVAHLRPRVAAVLNVSPDHLDRHLTFEAYVAAKERIFEQQQAEDYAVLNAADPSCRAYATRLRGQVRWFAADWGATPPPVGKDAPQGAQVKGDQVVWTEGGREYRVLALRDIQLRGAHNVENVLAAVALACCLGRVHLPVRGWDAHLAGIRDGVRAFKAVEHRLEFVAKIREVEYFNDSKATNVDATLKALAAFPRGVWLILGGKDKGSDYTGLAPLIRERTRAVLLIGAATEKIAAQLTPLGLQLTRAGTLERAVEIAAAGAQPGETVLLAPACASFDQFKNYEHRGRTFKELVARQLKMTRDA